MTTTLEGFAAKCHDLLKAEPGPAGREKVRALLEATLKDEAFVSRYLDDRTPERKILYEDPELRFCILAHAYHAAKVSPSMYSHAGFLCLSSRSRRMDSSGGTQFGSFL